MKSSRELSNEIHDRVVSVLLNDEIFLHMQKLRNILRPNSGTISVKDDADIWTDIEIHKYCEEDDCEEWTDKDMVVIITSNVIKSLIEVINDDVETHYNDMLEEVQ